MWGRMTPEVVFPLSVNAAPMDGQGRMCQCYLVHSLKTQTRIARFSSAKNADFDEDSLLGSGYHISTSFNDECFETISRHLYRYAD